MEEGSARGLGTTTNLQFRPWVMLADIPSVIVWRDTGHLDILQNTTLVHYVDVSCLL
jgi:hypothetical protein